MKKVLKIIIQYVFLFLFFGTVYFIIECVYKQSITDIRMFLLGGILGILIGLINNLFNWDTSFLLQCFVGMLMILLAEAITGYQWNIVEQLNIWDYSHLPFSAVQGQINLFFGIAWFGLSGVCIILDDILRWKFFNEDKPKYQLL